MNQSTIDFDGDRFAAAAGQAVPPAGPDGAQPLKKARVLCPRCGAAEFVDVAIHGGRSVRRDCKCCGWLIGFPVWYGRPADVDEGRSG